ncbi:DUF6973 domain-containing protein [Urechidicola vernalis]|uniref:DUF6973 domain-containing protein n=1 Tax=Urechidicola vernalis TaxID=3075600 RepID=A0ABU2Y2C9_9FLAO|nr:hypothetical protein [Urechidicola sp. P050]MDT0552351.1 hypothetical protein [Urechidicola sp. P050]
MALRTVLKQIKAKQLFGFFRFFIRHPLFAMATFFATVKTYKIAEKEFPKIHGKHNKANAFRHAIWNALIAKSCSRYSNNIEKILNWTKDVTDWHEELFVNDPLSRAMDIHNNEIGRSFFYINNEDSRDFIHRHLFELQKTSVKVSTIKEITCTTNELVYLED